MSEETRNDKLWHWRVIGVTAVLLLLLLSGLAAAQTGYHLDWWTVDGGGGTASGGSYALAGTIGQPDAGVLGGGSYLLNGGFWAETPQFHQKVYIPMFIK